MVLRSQNPMQCDGPIMVLLELAPDNKRKFDPDNFVKAVFDLLVANEVVRDDSNKFIPAHVVDTVYDQDFVGVKVSIWGEGEWMKLISYLRQRDSVKKG